MKERKQQKYRGEMIRKKVYKKGEAIKAMQLITQRNPKIRGGVGQEKGTVTRRRFGGKGGPKDQKKAFLNCDDKTKGLSWGGREVINLREGEEGIIGSKTCERENYSTREKEIGIDTSGVNIDCWIRAGVFE